MLKENLALKFLHPAEINEDFFTKAFGPDSGIENEEGMRDRLKNDLEEFYKSQGMSITKRKILEHLVDTNDMQLPDEFLKRWLLSSNDKLNEQQIEEEYPDFVKNLKWTLIKKELNKKYEINITIEDIKAAMIEKFKAQFAQYGYGMMGDMDYDGIADRMMQNQESVQKEYEELLAEGIMDKIVEEVSLKDKVISTEEYKKILDEFNQNKGS